MEWISVAKDLGFTPLNIVLVVMLYFMGAQAGIFPKLWKAAEKDEESDIGLIVKKILENQLQLAGHYNDATTRILTEIQVTLMENNKSQERMAAKLETILSTQNEMMKYGVPCRKSL